MEGSRSGDDGSAPRTVVIRVVDALVRDTLASWLASVPGYEVVGAVSTGQALVRLCSLRSPDVAVMQVKSADTDELAVVGMLRDLTPSPYLVGLHEVLDPTKLLRLHRAGVRRLVSSRFGAAGLRTALDEAEPRPAVPQTNGALSGRELEILALISAGCSAADISEALDISQHTVINHTRHIFAKLDVHSRMQAAAEASRLGLLPQNTTGARTTQPNFRLTPRERDILGSIALGHSVRQTAQALGIAVKTVQSEQRQLFAKLGARNRPAALAHARDLGLIDS